MPMLRTIDRYIILTFVKLFLLAMVALMLMLVTIDMLMQMDEFTEAFDTQEHYTTWDMLQNTARYYFYHLPVYVTFIGGVIIVAAAAFTIGWMNHTNELTAMLASGMSLHRVVLPIIIASMLVGLLIIVDQELIIPKVRSELIIDADETSEREIMEVTFLVDDEMAVWYSPKLMPADESAGQAARLAYPMIILRDGEFRYLAHIVGEQGHPLFDPQRNLDFEDKIGWLIENAEISRFASETQVQWQHTQKTSAIYTLLGPQQFFATAREANPNMPPPVEGQQAAIRKPSPQDDPRYDMRIRAYQFRSGPLRKVVDPATGRESLQFVEGELERPRFDFLNEKGSVLATIYADRATWVGDSLPGKRHWKLEGGVLFYPTELSPEEMELQISGSYLEYLSSGELTDLLTSRNTVDPSAVTMTKFIRFVEPLNNLVLLLLVLPFILSRERNLKYSVMLGVLIGAAFFIFIYICRYMDMGEFLSAFLPVLLFGPIAVLMLDSVKT